MKVEIYVQARMRSTRLPGKVMLNVLNQPLLGHLLDRLKQIKRAHAIAILTTTHPADDAIVAYCEQYGVPCYRGPEEDVLTRYYQVANKRQPQAIVRITSDCPLIDPDLVDELIEFYETHPCDYASNSLQRTYPRGLDAEIFSLDALEEAFHEANQSFEREHVTPYIYRHPELFRLQNLSSPNLNWGHHRWTVDTVEDFTLVRLILENLLPQNPQFRLKDILFLLEKHPDWLTINAHILQKPLGDF